MYTCIYKLHDCLKKFTKKINKLNNAPGWNIVTCSLYTFKKSCNFPFTGDFLLRFFALEWNIIDSAVENFICSAILIMTKF